LVEGREEEDDEKVDSGDRENHPLISVHGHALLPLAAMARAIITKVVRVQAIGPETDRAALGSYPMW
jgi:hypothetical protein